MMAREQRVDDLGQDGVLISHNAGKQRLPRVQSLEKVATDLVPDGASPERSLRPTAVLEITYGAWLYHGWYRSSDRDMDIGYKILGINGLVSGLLPMIGPGGSVLSRCNGAHLDKPVRRRTFALCVSARRQ